MTDTQKPCSECLGDKTLLTPMGEDRCPHCKGTGVEPSNLKESSHASDALSNDNAGSIRRDDRGWSDLLRPDDGAGSLSGDAPRLDADGTKVEPTPEVVEAVGDDNDLIGNTDAQAWAQRFVEKFGGDEGLMLTWFANAMMAAHDAARAAGRAEALEERFRVASELSAVADDLRRVADEQDKVRGVSARIDTMAAKLAYREKGTPE